MDPEITFLVSKMQECQELLEGRTGRIPYKFDFADDFIGQSNLGRYKDVIEWADALARHLAYEIITPNSLLKRYTAQEYANRLLVCPL